ncbi:MAG: IS6 family transposase [Steroidobacteraceae bacterium]
MAQAVRRDPIYRRRRYPPVVIEQCVRWYLTYRISYRDLVAMMAERDVTVTHTTIMRWVHRFVPEFERRLSRCSRPTHGSWRMDETAISVAGRWHYLYRAVDRNGKSIHSLLCKDRSTVSAKLFFRQAIQMPGAGWPQKINLDGNAASHLALRELAAEDERWQRVVVRARRYLNNIVEQDHRAIKGRCASMLGLKSFRTAAVTLSGIELAHRMRKRQFALLYERNGGPRSLKDLWAQGLSQDHAPATLPDVELPSMHQISRRSADRRTPLRRSTNPALRYARKISYGQSLYLLVMPNGGRYWRYRYRFQGREKMMSLGCYPDVPHENALIRLCAAKEVLASGMDPMFRRQEIRSQ